MEYSIREISNITSFNDTVANEVVVLDFYADWCKPCKSVMPEFGGLSNIYKNMVFAKVNIDNPDLSDIIDQYDVIKVPTFFVIKNNRVIKRIDGPYIDSVEQGIQNLFVNTLQTSDDF
jgi:thioredoxin 1